MIRICILENEQTHPGRFGRSLCADVVTVAGVVWGWEKFEQQRDPILAKSSGLSAALVGLNIE